MKKIIISSLLHFSLLLLTFAAQAASRAATEDWVKAYVASMNGNTNGIITTKAGTNTFSFVYEPFDSYALGVTNSVHATLTNGSLVAWCGNGIYSNAYLNAVITATPSNLVWNGVHSHTNAVGITMFANTFGVVGTYITSRKAKEIKGE